MKPSDYIDHRRLNTRLAQMAEIGAAEHGGVNRQALTTTDAQAQNRLMAWGRDIGLLPSIDDIGNLFLRFQGSDPSLDPVMTGSHMDSQPTGGRYDGIYGVMASLEALHAISSAGVRPRRSIDLVAWVNEEGSRFAPSLMGSGVYVGARSLEDAWVLRDAEGVSVREAIEALKPELGDLPRRPLGTKAAWYLEAHIEQGPILEQNEETIGVVTGIQGKHTYRVTVSGEAAHAGTAPHKGRKDALMAAAQMILAMGREFSDPEDVVRYTVGRFNVLPNAPSVVPCEVVFTIDLRHPDEVRLTEMSEAVPTICQTCADVCDVEVTRLYTAAPIEFDKGIQETIESVTAGLALPYRYLLSAAGHDAGLMQRMCPSGMVFIPCKDGITHNEAEYSKPSDITAGARVMADVLFNLAAT